MGNWSYFTLHLLGKPCIPSSISWPQPGNQLATLPLTFDTRMPWLNPCVMSRSSCRRRSCVNSLNEMTRSLHGRKRSSRCGGYMGAGGLNGEICLFLFPPQKKNTKRWCWNQQQTKLICLRCLVFSFFKLQHSVSGFWLLALAPNWMDLKPIGSIRLGIYLYYTDGIGDFQPLLRCGIFDAHGARGIAELSSRSKFHILDVLVGETHVPPRCNDANRPKRIKRISCFFEWRGPWWISTSRWFRGTGVQPIHAYHKYDDIHVKL